MNLFVYDDFVASKRHQTCVNRLETRLTDLSLSGKIIRLNNIRNIQNLILQEVRAGIKNIFIVGNNETVIKVLTPLLSDDLPDLLRNALVLSIIPIGKQNQSIAQSMGIYSSQEACNIILARLIKKIDLALADDNLFINKLELFNENIDINLFTDYTLSTIKRTDIKIYNVVDRLDLKTNTNILPDDGLLDLIINKKADLSYINFKKIKIKGAKEALLDDYLLIKNPNFIKVSDIQINFIVSKNRTF